MPSKKCCTGKYLHKIWCITRIKHRRDNPVKRKNCSRWKCGECSFKADDYWLYASHRCERGIK